MEIELTKKQKVLVSNIISIVMIVDIVYALIVFAQTGLDVMDFLKSNALVNIILVFVFAYFAYKILVKQESIKFESKQDSNKSLKDTIKPRKQQNNKRRTQNTNNNNEKPTGSSKCPFCKKFTYGTCCTHCKRRLV